MKAIIRLGVLTLAFAPLASAQTVTYAGLNIGGQGSLSSEHFDNPGLLADNMTPATGIYNFTLTVNADPTTGGTLSVLVQNTSPKLVSPSKNPKLNAIYFNAPAAVTGIVPASFTQSAVQGTPDFALEFVANPGNGIKADGFGNFSFGIVTNTGHSSAVVNPDAAPADIEGNWTTGATFGIVLLGDLTGVTAEQFVTELSNPNPSDRLGFGAGHFMAGGLNGAFSAFISDDHDILKKTCFLGAAYEPEITYIRLHYPAALDLDQCGRGAVRPAHEW